MSKAKTPQVWQIFLQLLEWRQDNRNRSNQESFLATRQCLVKIGEGLGWRAPGQI